MSLFKRKTPSANNSQFSYCSSFDELVAAQRAERAAQQEVADDKRVPMPHNLNKKQRLGFTLFYSSMHWFMRFCKSSNGSHFSNLSGFFPAFYYQAHYIHLAKCLIAEKRDDDFASDVATEALFFWKKYCFDTVNNGEIAALAHDIYSSLELDLDMRFELEDRQLNMEYLQYASRDLAEALVKDGKVDAMQALACFSEYASMISSVADFLGQISRKQEASL